MISKWKDNRIFASLLKHRRFVVLALSGCGIGFLLGFIANYHVPKLKTFVLVRLEEFSRKSSPVRIWPEDVSIHFIPLKLEFKNVRLLPKAELRKHLAPTIIKSVSVYPDLLAMLVGDFRIANVLLENGKIEVQDLQAVLSGSKKKTSKKIDLQFLENLPVDSISGRDMEFDIRELIPGVHFVGADFAINIEKLHKSIRVEIESLNLTAENQKKVRSPPLRVSLISLIGESGIQIQESALISSLSGITSFGTFEFSEGKFDLGKSRLTSDGNIDLGEFSRWSRVFSKGVTSLGRGNVKWAAQWESQKKNPITIALSGTNVGIEKYDVGNFKLSANANLDSVTIESFSIENSAGSAEIGQGQFGLTSPFDFSGNIQIKKLEVGQLLENLGIPGVPIEIPGSGKFSCSGQISPFGLDCPGELLVEKVKVTRSANRNIVTTKAFKAAGSVNVNANRVAYQTSIAFDEATGQSSGVIDFAKGFDIGFEGEIRNLMNIAEIFELKIEGGTKIKGSTQGTSQSANVSANLKSENLWFQDFHLGNSQFDLSYGASILNFSNVRGVFRDSAYLAHLDLNFKNELIDLNVTSPRFSLSDVKKILERKIWEGSKFPISGLGTTDIKLSGPLDVSKLKLIANANFNKGFLGSESFDRIAISVASQDGVYRAQNLKITKSKSILELKGKVDSKGQIDGVILGQDLRLDQSETLAATNLNLAGSLNFSALLKGTTKDPILDFNGKLSGLTSGDVNLEDIEGSAILTKSHVKGQGRAFGNAVTASFDIPFLQDLPFRFFMKTRDLDPAKILSAFTPVGRKKNFRSVLNSEIILRSETGGILNAEGHLLIPQVFIQRGSASLANTAPLSIEFDRGKIVSKNFALEGEQTYLRLLTYNSSFGQLNLSLVGNLDLALGSLLLPFVDDLGGKLTIAMNAYGSVFNPEILGKAIIDGGYFKFRDFPHPLEKVNAELAVKDKKIVLASLSANLGGGDVSAQGEVTPRGVKDVQIDLSSRFQDIRLQFPEGMKSKGSGSARLSGNWFPYKLSLNYDMREGVFERDFDGKAGPKTVRRNRYLPDFLIKDDISPLSLDLKINLITPIQARLKVNSIEIDTPLTGSLHILGTPDMPLLDGKINTSTEGKFALQNNIFEIRNGLVEFKKSKPDDPTLYILAQSRIGETVVTSDRKVEVNEYDVQILVQGKAANPKINFSSQPPLPEQEIISLIAFGFTKESMQAQSSSGNVAEQALYQRGTAIIEQQLGLAREIRNLFGVSLSLSSDFNSEDNTTGFKVTLTKQLSKKLTVSGSRTVGNIGKTEGKVEYRLNNNFSVVGYGETRERNTSTEFSNRSQERVGMDVEYRFEFK